jgi:hypothetical protein
VKPPVFVNGIPTGILEEFLTGEVKYHKFIKWIEIE